MAHQIDLGQATFYSSDLDLNVILHASVELFYEKDLSSVHTRDIQQLVQSKELWITQAPEVKLCLITAGSHSLPLVDTFFSRLGDLLCNLRLWSALNLVLLPRSSNQSFERQSSNNLRLSFGLCRKIGRSTMAKVTRIPTTIQATSDAVPPPTIATARLSSVIISLEYCCPQQDIPRFFPVEPASLPAARFQRLAVSSNKAYTVQAKNLYQGASVIYLRPLDEQGYCDALVSSDQAAAVNEDFRQPTKCHSQAYQYFVELFQKSFSSLFIDYHQRGNDSDLKDDRLQPLSCFVPSVFSIGYQEAMNQRSHLIPSIAKSLAFMLKTTEDPLLQRKTKEFQSFHCPEVVAASQSLVSSDMRMAIQSAFWKIAQKQLYHPQSLWKLDLLNSMDHSFDNHIPMEDNLFSGMELNELSDIHDYEDQELYDSDCYLGTGDENLTFEEDDDTDLLSLDRDCSLDPASMPEHDDSEANETWPTQTIVDCFQSRAPGSLNYPSEEVACQLSTSDGEMLASDFLEDSDSDPANLTYSPTSISKNLEAIVEDHDLMLCDDY